MSSPEIDAQRAPQASAAGPLRGISVVEYGEGVGAAFAAKLLADLGADVIKVEPPGGDIIRRRGPFPADIPDPEASGLFLYLNSNKRGVTLDLSDPAQRPAFERLLAFADILIHNVPPTRRRHLGLESGALCAAHPQLIVTDISVYGSRGPRANYHGYELNAFHSGGFAFVNPISSISPQLPPLKLPGEQAGFQGAFHAALAALAAYWHKMRTAQGQAVEVSEQECLAASMELGMVTSTYAGILSTRFDPRVVGPWTIVNCADGMAFIGCVEDHQWRQLVELMGEPAWVHDEMFKDRFLRARNGRAIREQLETWSRTKKVAELCSEARKRRIPLAPINRMRDLYADQQLRERHYFTPLPARDAGGREILVPGAPFKSSLGGWALRRPAPRLGEHNQEVLATAHRVAPAYRGKQPVAGKPLPGPLTGIRVIDFSWVWAGPFCALQLAHLGAEVIRIESSRRPDLSRRVPPYADRVVGLNRSGGFNQNNQSKRSVSLDLTKPEAVEIARALVGHADVVVENFAPGVMERMGLAYDRLRQVKPDLIMVSISGNGQTGPYSRDVSYGAMAGAQSGLYALNGYADGEPREIGITYPDPSGGLAGAFGVIAALIERARSGRGQYIDVSMLEVMETMMAEPLLEFALNGREPQPLGNRDRWMAPHQCYKAWGDANCWVTIAVGNDEEWRSLCAAIGQPALANDPRFATAALRKRNEIELDRIIEGWTAQRDRWEVTQTLQRAGVAAIPTLSGADLAADPHLRERGFLVELEHPEVGRRRHAGVPWSMSLTRCEVRKAAPLLGEDTESVLHSILGYSTAKIEELRKSEVLI